MYVLWTWAWPVGLAFVGAVFAWIAVKFLGDPIRKFWDLRGEVARTLHDRARFVAGTPETDMMFFMHDTSIDRRNRYETPRAEAISTFRSLGAQLVAFSSNEFLADPVLRLLGINAREAGELLIRLALSLEERNSVNAPRYDEICSTLKL